MKYIFILLCIAFMSSCSNVKTISQDINDESFRKIASNPGVCIITKKVGSFVERYNYRSNTLSYNEVLCSNAVGYLAEDIARGNCDNMNWDQVRSSIRSKYFPECLIEFDDLYIEYLKSNN